MTNLRRFYRDLWRLAVSEAARCNAEGQPHHARGYLASAMGFRQSMLRLP